MTPVVSTATPTRSRADLSASTIPLDIPYRFGFALTTALGNATRTENLRKYAERHAGRLGCACVFAPLSHWDAGADAVPRWMPASVRSRGASTRQLHSIAADYARFDAVVWHYNEGFLRRALLRRRGQKPLLVWAADAPPIVTPADYPRYPGTNAHPVSRAARLRLDRYAFARTDLFLPWSEWAAAVLTRGCGVPPERVRVLNVGVDLESYPFVPLAQRAPNPLPRILFVGGDFARKGGDLLLSVWAQRFQERAELDVVTKNAPSGLPPGVRIHDGITPNDGKLAALLAACDLFVLPTRADYSSYAAMEAMATGRAVVTTRTGGVPDVVTDGETGYVVPVDDKAALTERIGALLENEALRQQFGAAGRARVEAHFDAEANAVRMLQILCVAVDAARVPSGDPARRKAAA